MPPAAQIVVHGGERQASGALCSVTAYDGNGTPLMRMTGVELVSTPNLAELFAASVAVG